MRLGRNRRREAFREARREACGGGYVDLSPAEVAPIFERVTGVPGRGFTEIRPGWWVRPTSDDLFHVLHFLRNVRGFDYRFHWGVSIPWVPRVGKGRLRWHRTLKSAVFDLWDQPHDFLVDSKTHWREADAYFPDRSLGAQCFEEDLASAWELLRTPIVGWWKDAAGASGVLERAQEQATRPWEGAEHTPDPNFVAAFTLARLGQLDQAIEHIRTSREYREDPDLLLAGLHRVASEVE